MVVLLVKTQSVKPRVPKAEVCVLVTLAPSQNGAATVVVTDETEAVPDVEAVIATVPYWMLLIRLLVHSMTVTLMVTLSVSEVLRVAVTVVELVRVARHATVAAASSAAVKVMP